MIRPFLVAALLVIGAFAVDQIDHRITHTSLKDNTVLPVGNPDHGRMVIRNHRGGNTLLVLNDINDHLEKGWHYKVDGPCYSACTMVLLDPDLCVTDRALLGFHRSYYVDKDGVYQGDSQVGTNVLWTTYPYQVRQWIINMGGMPPGSPTGETLDLKGPELQKLVKKCS